MNERCSNSHANPINQIANVPNIIRRYRKQSSKRVCTESRGQCVRYRDEKTSDDVKIASDRYE